VPEPRHDRRGSAAWRAGVLVDTLGPLVLGLIVIVFLILLWWWGGPPFDD
jgi:hypothetical protein